MRFSNRMAAVAAAVVALGATAAVPALASGSHSLATVTVKASEFKFKLSTSSVAHGTVTFNVINTGHLAHDFKIAGKKTSLLAPGKSTKIKVTLKAGSYKYTCTVAGHAAAGMKGTLRVR
jgi:uncharacterized cupredoxin-like copper-binding protein